MRKPMFETDLETETYRIVFQKAQGQVSLGALLMTRCPGHIGGKFCLAASLQLVLGGRMAGMGEACEESPTP